MFFNTSILNIYIFCEVDRIDFAEVLEGAQALEVTSILVGDKELEWDQVFGG